MAAGTDCDLISLARLAVRSANEISAGLGTEVDGGGTSGDALTGFAAGFVGMALRGCCALAFSPACEAQIDATAATLPPLPPRADRISYFTSGLGVGGKAGKRGEGFDTIAVLFADN